MTETARVMTVKADTWDDARWDMTSRSRVTYSSENGSWTRWRNHSRIPRASSPRDSSKPSKPVRQLEATNEERSPQHCWLRLRGRSFLTTSGWIPTRIPSKNSGASSRNASSSKVMGMTLVLRMSVAESVACKGDRSRKNQESPTADGPAILGRDSRTCQSKNHL